MLDVEKITQLKQQLITEKDAVRIRLDDALTTLTGSNTSHVPTSHLIKLCRKENDILHQEGLRLEKLDAALCALYTGLYGLCADCEDDIELQDLEQDPAEPRCKQCREQDHYHHDIPK